MKAIVNSLHYHNKTHLFVDLALLGLFVSTTSLVEKEIAEVLDPVARFAINLCRGNITVTSLYDTLRIMCIYADPPFHV